MLGRVKISVITVVYNRAETVAHAIESLQAQTYEDVEHIVQDGGSTDGTLQILKARADGRTVIESRPDNGIYDAINRGIARASGDVIGILHSDDFFASPSVLEKVAEAVAPPDVKGAYGDLDYVSAFNPSRVVRRWRSGAYAPEKLAQGWMPPHPTLFLCRSVFQRWGGYDTSFRIAGDYDAMLRYLVRGRIRLVYIPEVLVKMRLGGESNRSLGRILQKSREDYRALRKNDVGGVRTLLAKNLMKFKQFSRGY